MRERDGERRVEGSLLWRDIEFHGNFAAALIRRVELQSNVGLAVLHSFLLLEKIKK